MAQTKRYYEKDGRLYKVCTSCRAEKPVDAGEDGFYFWYKDGALKVTGMCRACKRTYNYRYKMDRAKSYRCIISDLEEDLKGLQEYAESWREIVKVAISHPLSVGFNTPQDFILATLKIVYENGRETSKKEHLRPEAREEIPAAQGYLREKPVYLFEPVEQKPPGSADKGCKR